MSKAKPKPVRLTSWPAVNTILPELKTVEADLQALQGKAAAAIAAVKARHTDEIAALKERSENIRQGIFDFCADHRDELTETRSRQLDNGTVQLRWGPPKLVTLARITWEKVLTRALELPKEIQALFIKREPSLDRRALQKEIAEGRITDETRRTLGVDYVKEEYVYCEPS